MHKIKFFITIIFLLLIILAIYRILKKNKEGSDNKIDDDIKYENDKDGIMYYKYIPEYKSISNINNSDIKSYIDKEYALFLYRLSYKYNELLKFKLSKYTKIFPKKYSDLLCLKKIVHESKIFYYLIIDKTVIFINDNEFDELYLKKVFLKKNYHSEISTFKEICAVLNKLEHLMDKKVIDSNIFLRNEYLKDIPSDKFKKSCLSRKPVYDQISFSKLYWSEYNNKLIFHILYNTIYYPVDYNLRVIDNIRYDDILRYISTKVLYNNTNIKKDLVGFFNTFFSNIDFLGNINYNVVDNAVFFDEDETSTKTVGTNTHSYESVFGDIHSNISTRNNSLGDINDLPVDNYPVTLRRRSSTSSRNSGESDLCILMEEPENLEGGRTICLNCGIY